MFVCQQSQVTHTFDGGYGKDHADFTALSGSTVAMKLKADFSPSSASFSASDEAFR